MKNECKMCGGHLVVLGALGSLKWLRCQNCGMQFSRRIPMKTLKKKGAGYMCLLVITFLLPFAAFGQDETTEPKELTNLRAKKDKLVKDAIAPIMRDYVSALNDLKKQLGGKGNTAGMTAVQRELDLIPVAVPRGASQLIADAEKMIVGHWDISIDRLEVNADHTMKTVTGFSGDWEIKDGQWVGTFKTGGSNGHTLTAKLPLKKEMTVVTNWCGDIKFTKQKK